MRENEMFFLFSCRISNWRIKYWIMGAGACKRQKKTYPEYQPMPQRPPSPVERWPLPPDEEHKPFQSKGFTDETRYSLQEAYETKVSPSWLLPDIRFWVPNPQVSASDLVTTVVKRQHHQNDKGEAQWDRSNTSTEDSVHIQSNFQARSEATYFLSTNENVDLLMANLHTVHIRLDDTVKRRLDIISKGAEATSQQINVDTEAMQKDLLAYYKKSEMHQNKLYQKWLEMYVEVLDAWRTSKMAELHKKVCGYQSQILTASQNKIMVTNMEANKLKARILSEEQAKASRQVNQIIAKIESIASPYALRHLGSEVKTRIDVTIQANAGNKASGQPWRGAQQGTRRHYVIFSVLAGSHLSW